VDVRWGHEFTDLESGADGVAVTVPSPAGVYTLDATFLVGADGGRSPVRKRVGIDFPGYTSDIVARLAPVRVPDGLRSPDGGIDIPGLGPVRLGHNRFDSGVFFTPRLSPAAKWLAPSSTDPRGCPTSRRR
jgi:2-polyprenyl-6-methoxyphenol hydroxylase-like FAD-dependent oxidoreductase